MFLNHARKLEFANAHTISRGLTTEKLIFALQPKVPKIPPVVMKLYNLANRKELKLGTIQYV